MIIAIIIAFFSVISLLVLHEFGHFIIAKKFGIKVEEFGIGYPPRLFGKKIGETIYSLNLLPFGAFVRIPGEGGEKSSLEDYRSFTGKPLWQRTLIVMGGVISFWIIAAVLLSFVFGLGAPLPVSDEENQEGLINPKVQIAEVAKNSPAEKAGLQPLDAIIQLRANGDIIEVNKVKEVIEFTDAHKEKEVFLTLDRWGETLNVSLIPRLSPPPGEGAMGISLVRTALKSFPWYEAPLQGIAATWNLTAGTVKGLAGAFLHIIQEKETPSGFSLMGPVGIVDFLRHALQLGINYFLYFIALISVFLAIANLLPIPALDGGKLVFLGIEKIKGKPVNQKIEQNITVTFFFLIIFLMIWVTIKDISRLF